MRQLMRTTAATTAGGGKRFLPLLLATRIKLPVSKAANTVRVLESSREDFMFKNCTKMRITRQQCVSWLSPPPPKKNEGGEDVQRLKRARL